MGIDSKSRDVSMYPEKFSPLHLRQEILEKKWMNLGRFLRK